MKKIAWLLIVIGTLAMAPTQLAEQETDRSEVDTPLHIAIKQLQSEDSSEEISKLLRNGADANILTPDGQTPLALAANSSLVNAYGVVGELIRYGADVNQPNDMGCEPIAVAALAKNVAVVDLLIRNGADVHGRDTSCKPILWAYFGNDKQVIALLEKFGAKSPERLQKFTESLSSGFDRQAELLNEPVPEGMDRAEFSARQTIASLMEELGHIPRWKFELEERLRLIEANPRAEGESRSDWKAKLYGEAKTNTIAKFGPAERAQ